MNNPSENLRPQGRERGENAPETSHASLASERSPLASATLPGLDMRQVMTVDGLSGTGKTTLAKELAKKLNWVHLSSGLLYRAVGLLVRDAKLPLGTEDTIGKTLEHILVRAATRAFSEEGHKRGNDTFAFKLKVVNENGVRSIHVFYERKSAAGFEVTDITDRLLNEESIAHFASKIAKLNGMRGYLKTLQLQTHPHENLVVDGRDSHKVFKKAAVLKFWVATNVSVKATRQVRKNWEGPLNSEFQALVAERAAQMVARDKSDKTNPANKTARPHGPDVVIVNNDADILSIPVDAMFREATTALGKLKVNQG